MLEAWGIARIPTVVSREGMSQLSREKGRTIEMLSTIAKRQSGELYSVLEHVGVETNSTETGYYTRGKEDTKAGWVPTGHRATGCRMMVDGVLLHQ